MTSQTIQIPYEIVDHTLAFQLFNEINKKNNEVLPASLKKEFKDALSKLGHLNCTNLYIFHKINSLIDFINTVKNEPEQIKALTPNDIGKCGNIFNVISIVNAIINKFDKEKMTENHMNNCNDCKLLYTLFWHSFILSLYGQDFGVLLSKIISEANESEEIKKLNELNEQLLRLLLYFKLKRSQSLN